MAKKKEAEPSDGPTFTQTDDGYDVSFENGVVRGRVTQTDEGWFVYSGKVRTGPFETRGAAANHLAPT